ncbi:Serine/threonine-protein kinase PrkC [Planctomycetes bacterium CA13]|uniref:Serine/threonine-protein kinase PrkC n=1 Tax=Novipirellula herctigrandis TaxID=2527986 RepID=A0A5C5YPD8_9BACT|nr:Serine/threonine-protein kinase PrkC [Planctomycetes bacterium CA13]
MASDGSIRTDASTVHRGSSKKTDIRKKSPGGQAETDKPASSDSSAELEELADAKTIIRGSSRVRSSGSDWSRSDRTPASVAGVLLGQRLNHFLLEDFVGGGGMGAVFRAHDEQLDRTVAIKVIPFVGDDPDLKRRFRNEAQSAAKLDHPRIAKVFDVGTDDDWHYIVFEYIQGTNIRDLVTRDGLLPIDEAVFFTCQLADAIQHASDRGVVHRDIKPSNVLIGEGDTIKLVDMGLARTESLDLNEDMTASGVTLGTFDYISPEQANDPRDADFRSDIYSLGCTLYFMLAGEPPYPGGTMLQKLMHHGKTPPPDIRLLREEVSEDLAAVIKKMLAKDPEDRYQHANDLVADLQEVAYREGLQRVQTLGPVTINTPGPFWAFLDHHAAWLVAFGLLLISVGVLYVVGQLSKGQFAISVPASKSVEFSSANLPQSPLQKGTSQNGVDLGPFPGDLSGSNSADFVETSPRATMDSATLAPSAPPRIRDLPVPEELSREETMPLQNNSTNIRSNPNRTGTKTDSRIQPQDQPALGSLDPNVPSDWRPRAIRVSQSPPMSADGDNDSLEYAYASSLEEAIEFASSFEVDRIELAEPLIRSAPVTIDRDGLVISSSVGGTVIVFESDSSAPMQHAELIKIGTNRIELEDIHITWTVPSGGMSGGCIFSMNANRLVRLTDCSVTINNSVRQSDVYAFEIETDPKRKKRTRERSDEASDPLRSNAKFGDSNYMGSLPLVSIEMYNVCIRGQMTMAKMDTAAELQMRWENGLLAITGRMIETAGLLSKPLPSAKPIQLRLERLLVMAPRGFLRMRLDADHPYPLQVDREAKNCVFIIQGDVPVAEFSGTSSLANSPPVLVLRGEANAYDAKADLSDVMLRLVDTKNEEAITRMVDLKDAPPTWAVEQSSRWAVDWASETFKSQPVNQLMPQDFLQYGAVISGFNEKALTIMTRLEAAKADEEI